MRNVGRWAWVVMLAWGASAMLRGQTRGGGGEWVAMFDGTTLRGWKETSFSGRGRVEVRDGKILLGMGRTTGITWTGAFPRVDYELRFEAARLEGKDFFAGVTFPVGGSHCSWISGGWDGTVVGLSSLDGDDASENVSSTIREFALGRWYRFRLEVTERRIRCWIDDEVVIDTDLAGHQPGLPFGEADLSAPVGFASYRTVGGVRKIEYRRLYNAVQRQTGAPREGNNE